MTRRLTTVLRAAPATVPALVSLILFVVWSADQAGDALTSWAPGGLVVLALAGLTLAVVPLRLSELPVALRVAAFCLAAYTALSFLSILWAGAPGDAWEGADRTLLYLLVFLLFAAWRQQGASAALILTVWVLALVGLALFVLLHLDGANLARTLPGGRLDYPSGYVNANAAQWMMAAWPALLMARERRLPWGLRGLLAAGAVLLVGVAFLSQSRGSLYATPLMLIGIFALLPGRLRTFVVFVPVAAGVGVSIPALLRVGDRVQHGGDAPAAMHQASAVLLGAALAVGIVVALFAAVERRQTFSPRAIRRTRAGVGTLAVLALAAVIAGGLVFGGSPVTRLKDGWHTFKAGYSANVAGNHLVSGLGSNRYDFYRVALDEFVAHPVLGIGADNYAQQYLRHGRSDETPRYPHSVELRTLAETGILGALLGVVGLGAALLAVARAMRGPDPLARAVAAAALSGFAYWLVHGSFDWFWELAGLGGPAFALLGLACALAPAARDRALNAPAAARHRLGRPPLRLAARLALVAVALLGAGALAAPWLSRLQVQSAARVWVRSRESAYTRLADAARLDPLGDHAYLVAGSIALRFGELSRADRQFALALGRVPGDAYATLERGAIASTLGRQRDARRLLKRAIELNPRDPLTIAALAAVTSGERVDVNQLNRSILLNAQQIS